MLILEGEPLLPIWLITSQNKIAGYHGGGYHMSSNGNHLPVNWHGEYSL